MALPRAEAFALDRRPASRAERTDSEPAAARGEAAGRAIRLAHRLSRTQACTRVSCSMWACAEALGSRGESHVHVPGRLLTCGAV